MICSRKNVPTYLLVAAVRTQWTSRDVGSITTWLVFTFTSLVKNNLLTGDQPRVSGGWGLAKWYSLEVFEPTTFSSFRLRTQNHRANILLAKVWLSRSKLGLFDIKIGNLKLNSFLTKFVSISRSQFSSEFHFIRFCQIEIFWRKS